MNDTKRDVLRRRMKDLVRAEVGSDAARAACGALHQFLMLDNTVTSDGTVVHETTMVAWRLLDAYHAYERAIRESEAV